MKIGVTGGKGFVGSTLRHLASEQGDETIVFSRAPRSGERKFSLESAADVDGLDAVVHLAGESILGLWTPSKKQKILDSRVEGTHSIVDGIQAASRPPRVLISASAVGIYGDTGDTAKDESSGAGTGFLVDVAREWEAEAYRARELGVRVVCLRIGFVIGPGGGAMKLIKPVFKAGLGGKLGNGHQWMSGVHVEDVAGLALWAIQNEAVSGPVNAVMPEPFRNEEFTRVVAEHFHRPAFLPAPAFALRMTLGGLANVLLDDCRVIPRVAEVGGYDFRYPDLRRAIASVK